MTQSGLSSQLLDPLTRLQGLPINFDPSPAWLSQPLHTVYVSGELVTIDTPHQWRDAALTSIADAGGLAKIAEATAISIEPSLNERVLRKLNTQPIEDLRFDFEDGYGYRSDAEEDAAAANAGEVAAQLLMGDLAPNRVGLRVKPLDTRGSVRSIRTLELFLSHFVRVPGAKAHLDQLRITLPKVMHLEQIRVSAEVCALLESALGLAESTLRIEVQVEVPHLIAPTHPTQNLSTIAAHPRVCALHFGTYDYTSAQGVMPGQQRSTHPTARHAKRVIQAAAACSGIEISDGSSNFLAIGNATTRKLAWQRHTAQILEATTDGFVQGWDLHPTQLPTRYLASFAALRAELPAARERLIAAHERSSGTHDSAMLDEPATLRMLGGVLSRAIVTGAIGAEEIGLKFSVAELQHIARTGTLPGESDLGSVLSA